MLLLRGQKAHYKKHRTPAPCRCAELGLVVIEPQGFSGAFTVPTLPPLKGEVPAARAVWFGNTEFGNSICPAAIEEYSSQTSVGVWGEREAERSLPQPARVGNADQ